MRGHAVYARCDPPSPIHCILSPSIYPFLSIDANDSFQAAGMFVGELLCLFAFFILRWRAHATNDKTFKEAKPYNPIIFLLPALCDMTATSLMYLGLSLTDASSALGSLRARAHLQPRAPPPCMLIASHQSKAPRPVPPLHFASLHAQSSRCSAAPSSSS